MYGGVDVRTKSSLYKSRVYTSFFQTCLNPYLFHVATIHWWQQPRKAGLLASIATTTVYFTTAREWIVLNVVGGLQPQQPPSRSSPAVVYWNTVRVHYSLCVSYELKI